ncbi:aldo/keto reductase [Flavilitoribacter nigricans]|uniref:Aldo/keto reductase n=1 Tax=Flavilitoribacter nigricans (strain ATCC 23147 / DSM 23189 / NBRC 102662 / NCIMB 1420 / SS-2) TaxID=1122177 RepID=A0A2D0NID1_FLAN2|nr:aldo/keto reductase [Flavilitoribacter nigricans]PHN08150.1 aldo/keto reductase [Flavilitoribacter nigricans DSM 23189 = NBRC 102662]
MTTISTHTNLAPDLKISRILTGLWQIADMERDGRQIDLEQTAQHMRPYLAAGLSTFDMADHYGSAELIAGKFRQEVGADQVQLLTKWVPTPGRHSKATVREAVQRALDRLQMEQLDLLQYHAWNYADPAWLDDLFWLQELREEGLIRHLGLTNFDAAHLNLVIHSGIRVVSNQISYSLIDQRAAVAMTQVCREHGIKILAFGTLAGGLLTEKWIDRPEIPANEMTTWSQMKYKRFIDVAGGWKVFQSLLKTLEAVARKHQVSIANVATGYLLQQPEVGGVIIGARLGLHQHIENNLRTLQLQLDDEDRKEIQTSLNRLDPIPGHCGDEYRRPPFLTASGDLSHHIAKLPPPYPVQESHSGRQKALSGTVWEDLAGFSRAVRVGNRILVSGTTATHGDRLIGGNDPAAQTHFVIDKIAGAIQSLGGQLEDVVRTRIFVQRLEDWEAVARAHGQRFAGIQPANTLVRADLVGDGYLVEMEAEAVLDQDSGN